jgi:hypothetical protein
MKSPSFASSIIRTIGRRRQAKSNSGAESTQASSAQHSKRPDSASQLANFGAYLKEMSYRRGLERVTERVDHHIERAFDQIRREEQDIIHKLLCLD